MCDILPADGDREVKHFQYMTAQNADTYGYVLDPVPVSDLNIRATL